MKRLFAVRKEDGKCIADSGFSSSEMTPDGPVKNFVIKIKYFSSKQEAKVERDLAIELTGKPHFITRGPDHMGKHSTFNKQRRNK